jgi:formylglycine-generating enzyme required for sulfatase activity
MNTRNWTIQWVALVLALLVGSETGAARAENAPGSLEEQADFKPGDRIVTRQPTALRAGDETLASLPPGTHLAVIKVNPPWLAASLQKDGKTVAGWISSSDVSLVVTNSIGMKLVPIPAGEFMMGSAESAGGRGPSVQGLRRPPPDEFEDEHPQHRVRITRPFYLGVHEVTVGQFRQFVEETGYRTDAEKGTDFKGAFGFDRKRGSLASPRSTRGGTSGSSRPTSIRWST